MDVVHCKDCTHYKVCIRDGHKDCEFIDGLFNAKEDDFCSFASTEDNDDAGYECNYTGIHCEDCAWYDGYLEECVAQNDNGGYCGLLDPQPWNYCSRAERKVEVDDERFQEWLKINGYFTDRSIDIDTLKEVFEAMDDEDK